MVFNLVLLILLQYNEGEEVVLWMNTVGPYHNQQETYKYFSLPFCRYFFLYFDSLCLVSVSVVVTGWKTKAFGS